MTIRRNLVYCQHSLICEGVLINKNIGYSAKLAIVPIFGGPTAGTISGMLCTTKQPGRHSRPEMEGIKTGFTVRIRRSGSESLSSVACRGYLCFLQLRNPLAQFHPIPSLFLGHQVLLSSLNNAILCTYQFSLTHRVPKFEHHSGLSRPPLQCRYTYRTAEPTPPFLYL